MPSLNLEPQGAEPSPAAGDGLRFLRIALLIIVAGAPCYGVLLYFFAPEQYYRAVGPLLLMAVALPALILLQRGSVTAALRVLVFGAWAAIAINAVFAGGLRTPMLVAFPLFIVMAGWLLGLRAGIVMAGLALASSTLFALAESAGILPQAQAAPPLLVWFAQAIIDVIATVLLAFVLHRYEQRYRAVQDLGDALAGRVGALAAKEAQLRLLTENIPAFIFHGGNDLRCRFANRRYAEFFGFTPESVIGKHIVDILGEDATQAIQARLRAVLDGETVRYRAMRRSAVDGQERALDITFVPERDEAGAVAGFYALKLDVTTEVRAEQALLDQKAFLDALVQSQSDAGLSIFIIDAGRIIYANDAACRTLGYPIEELRALPSYVDLVHPASRELIGRNYRQRLQGEAASNNYRISYLTKAGERREADLTAALMPGPDSRVLIVLVDATDRVRAEEALKTSQAQLEEAQRIGHIGSWALDLSSGRIEWSDEVFRLLECRPEEFGGTGKALLDRVHPDDLDAVRRVFRESTGAGKAYEIDHRILTPGGQTKHVHVRWEVFPDDRGRPSRALGTVQDVTEQALARAEVERLNAELETRVQERTAELTAANRELESFAYSISHDLRAPLRGIDGFSHLLAEEYAPQLDDTGRGYLDRVRRAAQRMGALIDDILELSRVTRQEMRRVRVDLSQIAVEVLDERARAEPAHRVEAVIAPDCQAFGDPQLLRVLMQNLLENAWKYSARQAAPASRSARSRSTTSPSFSCATTASAST